MGVAEKYILENVSTIPPEVQNIIANLIKMYSNPAQLLLFETNEFAEKTDETFYEKIGLLDDYNELEKQLNEGTAKIYDTPADMWNDFRAEGII